MITATVNDHLLSFTLAHTIKTKEITVVFGA